MTLEPACGQCNINEVCNNKVRDQVGFEVVLLDSKCYPLVTNGDTSDPDLWKSTIKIIAGPREVYISLGGIPAQAKRKGSQFCSYAKILSHSNKRAPKRQLGSVSLQTATSSLV